MTNFREAIAAIPHNPSDQMATGILAPIMRASGHILYAVGALAEPGYNLTDEEVGREIDAAAAHLIGTVTTAERAPLSTAAKDIVRNFSTAVLAAGLEYRDWPHDERGRNLKDLADRATSLAAFFDNELAAVRGSQPGRTL